MKKLEDYKKLNYRMVFEYDQNDGVYYVKFPELQGCIAHGETPSKALKNALAVKNEWLKTAIDAGWTILEPSVQSETSGRITLRIPKYLHEKIIDRTEQEGVSLNQLILSFVSEGLERVTGKDYLEKIIEQNTSKTKQLEGLAQESTMWKKIVLDNWGNAPYPTSRHTTAKDETIVIAEEQKGYEVQYRPN